jgi:outer membrane protein assembly factor BamB
MNLKGRVTRALMAWALLLRAAVGLAQEPSPRPATWSQWRGPTRDGRVTPGIPWPATLGESALRLLWRVPLGPGYCSPLVTDERVYTVETEANEREVVRAFDRTTGKEVWNTNWTGALRVPFFARSRGSWARCTPCLSSGVLYVGGMRDVLACIDAVSGRELWRVDFMDRYQSTLPDFGFVSSPLATADGVYVQAGASVLKLNPVDGRSLWRTLEDGGGMWHSAFSSPMLAVLHDRPQLVVQTRALLAGVDLGSGAVLWSVEIPAFRGMNILNPTVIGNQVFTSSYGGGSFLFEVLLDQGRWSVRSVWKNRIEGYMSTPIVHDGGIYLLRRDQRFCCLDWVTGTEKWVTQEKFGQYWSMVTDGQRILALDQKGELLLIRPDPGQFVLLERRKVSDHEAWAHLAATDGCLFIRELNAIAAWAWK